MDRGTSTWQMEEETRILSLEWYKHHTGETTGISCPVWKSSTGYATEETGTEAVSGSVGNSTLRCDNTEDAGENVILYRFHAKCHCKHFVKTSDPR
jgi:hypothetical protein